MDERETRVFLACMCMVLVIYLTRMYRALYNTSEVLSTCLESAIMENFALKMELAKTIHPEPRQEDGVSRTE